MNYFIQFLTYFRILIAPIIFLLITFYDLYGWALFLFFLLAFLIIGMAFLQENIILNLLLEQYLDPIADKILATFLILALSIELSSIFVGMVGGIILVREFWVGALRDLNARQETDATKVTFLLKSKHSFNL